METAPTGETLRSPQEAHLRFGPRWRVLDRTAYGDGEGIARLSLPAAAARDGCYLHPGLLDLATGWAMRLIPSYTAQTLWVPVSYGSIRVFGPLSEQIHSHVRLADGSAPGVALFDVTLCNPDGARAGRNLRLSDETARRALDLSAPDRPDATAVDLGLQAPDKAAPLSPEERRLHHNIGNGIRADEGPEALTRRSPRAVARWCCPRSTCRH